MAIPILIPINNVTYFIIHIEMCERTINMQLLLLLSLDIRDRF